MRRFVAAAILAVLLAGCRSVEDDMVDGTVWTASQVAGQDVGDAEVTAIFEDGRMGGRSGCNLYGAGYEISGTRFALTEPIMSTLMACDEGTMDLEQRYLRALESATGFAMTESSLELTSEDGQILVAFSAVSQELTQTSWEIVSYLDDPGRVSVLPDTQSSVSFDGSRLWASAGCNTVDGVYEAERGSLAVGELTTTDIECMEPVGVMEQESAVAEALRAAARYRVEGRTMTIWNESGTIVLELSRR